MAIRRASSRVSCLKAFRAARLLFVIDKGEGLPLVIADAEAVRDFVHSPR